jgi:hypothetical protein
MLNLSEEIYTRSEHGARRIVRRDDGRRPGPHTYALAVLSVCAFLPTAILCALSAPTLIFFHRWIASAVKDTSDARRGLVKRGSFWLIRAWVHAYVWFFRRSVALLPGPIMKGDLEEIHRRYRIDPETRPELHAENVAMDVRRALWADGRTIAGELPAPLGDVAVSERTLVDQSLIALQVFLSVFLTIFGIWFVGLALLGASPMQLLEIVPMAVLVSLSAGFMLSVDASRYALSKMRALVGVPTRDLALWSKRPETRVEVQRLFAGMTHSVTGFFKEFPLLVWGQADGVARLRGDPYGPQISQPIASDLKSLMEHVFVAGATGTGKTTFAFRKVAQFFMSVPNSYMMVLDDKAVLWKDIKRFADAAGRGDDVRIIGIERDQYHTDLLDGLNPNNVQILLKACLPSNSKADFWEKSGFNFLFQMMCFARAFEATPKGLGIVERTGDRIYSLGWVYQAMQDRAQLAEAIAYVVHLFDTMPDSDVVALIDTEETRKSIRYLTGNVVMSAGDKMKESIIATMENELSGLCNEPALRRFAWASDGGMAIRDIFDGTITCAAISTISIGGGSVGNMMIKGMFVKNARERQNAHGESYCLANPGILLMDEAQAILSVGAADSGIDDLAAPAVLRSAGCCVTLATQSVSSLVSRIGGENTNTLLQNLSTRILLRTQDVATTRWFDESIAKHLRSGEGEGPESMDDRIIRGFRPLSGPYVRDLFPASGSPWNLVLAWLAPLSLLNVPLRGSVTGGYSGSLALRILEGLGTDFHNPSPEANEAHAMSEAALLQRIQQSGGSKLEESKASPTNKANVIDSDDIKMLGKFTGFILTQRADGQRFDKFKLVHEYF